VLLASTNPAVVSYDPAWAYEVSLIVEDGLRRMYGDDPENIYYYLTVYNEPYLQPAMPDHIDPAQVLKGMYRYAEAPSSGRNLPKAQILASGVAMQAALKAQSLLSDEWGVAADVWSVTSWNELRRDAVAAEEEALLSPDGTGRTPYVTEVLTGSPGPVVAVSDYMRAVQDQISRWVPTDYTSLGTDGFGCSDTRGALRRHFHVDAESITVATLRQLVQRGELPPEALKAAQEKYRIDDVTAAPPTETAGGAE
jgi:pyruvate dehydrogenase E1 component